MTPITLSPDRRDALVSQLDCAVRAVGAARLAGDPAAEATAHARVHTAKSALGQSDGPWWEHSV